MPRFTAAPGDANSAQLILDKDTYNFEIGKPTTFIFDKDPNKISYGVQYPLTVISEGKYKGKTISFRCFDHTQGSKDMYKRFLVAAEGFNPQKQEEEEQWNAQYSQKDWSFDTDTKIVGDGWLVPVGKIITADADIKEKDGNMNQQLNFKPYLP